MFRKPIIFSKFPQIIAAESTRHGGVSPVPYSSLNLGKSSGDKIENVLENRTILFNTLGIDISQVTLSHQVHGNSILHAEKPGNYEGFDAIITNKINVFIAVSIADCVPILLYDSKNDAVAAIHAGWRGTVKKIVSETLQKLHDTFQTQPENCYAYIGTCIDECSFEVGIEVADEFESNFKRFDEEKQKFYIDLKKANAKQLTDFGIPTAQIEISPYSTVLNNEDYFSFRKENGKTGRMMAVIGIKK